MSRQSHRHPLFARFYVRFSQLMEATVGEHRDRLLAGLTGRVVEIGAGNGMNFAHYPETVDEVLAVEPEPYLRAKAEKAARTAPIPIRVVDGVGSRIPANDASFDAAVASLVLCSVDSITAVLAEVRRVLRPDGELRFFEHVRAETPGLARFQRVLDATVWPLAAGGCHTSRQTVEVIRACGYEVVELDRFNFPETGAPLPTRPHAIGRANPIH